MKKKILALATVLALVGTLVVPMAASAGSDTAAGTLNGTNLTPDVTAVELYNEVGCTTIATSLTPGVLYWAKVTVSEPNTLADLSTVNVTFNYFGATANVTGDPSANATDTQTVVHLTCTVSGPTWAVVPGADATHTWAIDSSNCSQPVLTGTTDSWKFAFKPGKVATEADAAGGNETAGWGVYAKALDAGALSDGMWWESGGSVKKVMNWYGELAIDLVTVVFGNIAPGVSDLASPNFVLTNIVNGAYQIQLKSSDTWECSSPSWTLTLEEAQSPGAQKLALEADDDADVSGAQLVKSSDYAQYTGHNADPGPTAEAGAGVNTNTLWLSLGATGVRVGTYTGNLYYQVLNN